ncbi:MAG: hypothetical protein IT438_11710 [Phycisphaerales bacterium]|nr:hypothetical protein [Phycisphaerales bacterium]
MADYLPGPDADYQAWVANFVTYASANMGALGLVAADLAPVSTAQSNFSADFADHIAARAAAQAAKQAKDEARAACTAAIRPLVRRLQASPSVSNAEREALGITVAATPGPIGAPTTAPIVSIECGNRLQHTLRFVDSASPTRKAKPAGVLGVEIWSKVGTTPPAGEGELRFVAIDTDAPFVLNYTSEDGNKNAYYWLRWVNPTGERGPWSEQAQATIAA